MVVNVQTMRWARLPEMLNLPAGWQLRRLLSVAQFIAGQSPDSERVNTAGSGLPFLQGCAEFADRHPVPLNWCIEPERKVDAGATLVSVRAPVGDLNRADQSYGLGRGLGGLVAEGIDSDYLYHGMFRWRCCLQRVGQGTTFDAVTARHFAAIVVALPIQKAEQRAIAAVLDAADAAIERTRAAVVAARRLKRGLVQSLLTCGIGPDGRIRDPQRQSKEFTATQFGTFPKSWEFVRTRGVADVGSGVTLGKDLAGIKTIAIPYLRVANVQDGYIDTTEMKTVRVPESDVKQYLLQTGDVLMTEGGDFDKLGRGGVWDDRISPCLHQNHVFRVRPNQARLDPQYLSAVIAAEYGKRYFMRIAKRTTNLASINKTQLNAFPFFLPSLKEQHRIVEILNVAESNIHAIEQASKAHERLKRGLMQVLLTGRVRVPVGEI